MKKNTERRLEYFKKYIIKYREKKAFLKMNKQRIEGMLSMVIFAPSSSIPAKEVKGIKAHFKNLKEQYTIIEELRQPKTKWEIELDLNHRVSYNYMAEVLEPEEPIVCKYFTCNAHLSPTELLCGGYCIAHSKPSHRKEPDNFVSY